MIFLQKLVDKFYRYPLSNWRTKQRFGGYFAYQKMLQAQQAMVLGSKQLSPIISYSDGFPIYFLTGKKYLHQTLFCTHSLNQCSTAKFQFVLVDDGSFDQNLINQAYKQMPNVKLVLKAEIEKNLELNLPSEKYPYLHHKRQIYPHIKKLTDIHSINGNPIKLVLDSDMLFWNEPNEIIEWLKNPIGCLYMLDCEESYGYDTAYMQTLCGHPIPTLMNVGAFGLNSNIINWSDLETWCKSLEEKQGASYFLEQALSAMLVAKENKTILSKDQYLVNPDEKTMDLTKEKLHHYVDLSKKYYYEKAWKKLTIL